MVEQLDDSERSTCLKCIDNKCVTIGSDCIQRCQLIQSLPSLPDDITVPFSEQEVATWVAYSDSEASVGDVSFSDCMSILKVADFLQDQDVVEAAAKAANACLLQPSRKRKRSGTCSKDALKRCARALQSLPSHLAQAVVKSGGQLQDWMEVLPNSCLPIIVPAAVESGTLSLHPDDHESSALALMLAAAQPLPTLSSLEVAFPEKSAFTAIASKAADTIGSMTQLRSLSLINIAPPEIPGPLTALTKVSLDCSEATKHRAKLQTDISVFTALKELAMINVPVPSFEGFCGQLSSLTALTSLELCWSLHFQCQATITAPMSESLAQTLASLTALASLTLGIPQTVREEYTRCRCLEAESMVQRLHSSIIGVLPKLPDLTSLSFRTLSTALSLFEEVQLQHAWPSMKSLRTLSFQSSCLYSAIIETLQKLPALEHFHHNLTATGYMNSHEGDNIVIAALICFDVTQYYASYLPTTLTSLKLDWMMPVPPDFGELPNLKSIELNGCMRWCQFGQPPTMTKLTGLTSLHTGPPVEDFDIFWTRRAYPHDRLRHDRHTPELDLLKFVSALPTSLCDLQMPGHGLDAPALQQLCRLSMLTSLDVGTVPSSIELVAFCGVVQHMQALYVLYIRFESPFMSENERLKLLESLEELPCFKELHLELDAEGFGAGELAHMFGYKIVCDLVSIEMHSLEQE